jgi:hypothetical protein
LLRLALRLFCAGIVPELIVLVDLKQFRGHGGAQRLHPPSDCLSYLDLKPVGNPILGTSNSLDQTHNVPRITVADKSDGDILSGRS